MDAPKLKNDGLLDEVNFDPALGRALGFNHDDLLANREGRLSEKQLKRFPAQPFKPPEKDRALEAGVTLLALSVFIFFLGLIITRTDKVAQDRLIFWGLPGLLALLLLIIINVRNRDQTPSKPKRTNENLRVYTLKSHIRLSLGGKSHDDVSCYLTLEELELIFKISKKAMLAFHDGDLYRIYCGPSLSNILSAEPLES